MIGILKNLCAVCLAFCGALLTAAAEIVLQKDGGEMPAVTGEWVFAGGTYNVTYQGNSGTVKDGADNLELAVDATSGKFAASASYAQVNTGTVISVPVRSAGDVVTIVAWDSNYCTKFSRGDVAFTEATTVLTATSAEAGAGKMDIIATGDSYLRSIKVELAAVSALPVTTQNIEAWDFGAAQLDASIYANMLTVDEINSWYPEGTEAGTKGVNIPGFESKMNLAFTDGGNPKSHRIRTTNAEITRYDEKSLTDADKVVYNGYIYSNAGSSTAVTLAQVYNVNDKVVFYVGSNGNAALYKFTDADGNVSDGNFTAAVKIEPITFYPAATGKGSIYCSNEKLVVARILRYKAVYTTVTGNITAPEGMPSYELVFTNKQNGVVTKVTPSEGAYSVSLATGFDYEISIEGTNEYVSATKELSVDYLAENVTKDVTISAVSLSTISGNIVGLGDEIANLSFEVIVPDGKVFLPVFVINGDGSYSVKVEDGVNYTLKVNGVNDYALDNAELVATSNITADITFTAKAKYAVTIAPTGATLSDLASATFTFTNLNESGYVYEFVGTDAISLRNGTYSVKVTNSGVFAQLLTSNVVVNDAAVSKVIDFTSDPFTEWIFTDASFTGAGYTNTAVENTYNGLAFVGGKSHNSTYLFMGAGSVDVPVTAVGNVVVAACYQYYFGDMTESIKTNSTSQIDEFKYAITDADVAAGKKTIEFKGTSYVNYIKVVSSVDYKPVVTVGTTGCDATTINGALDLVRKMARTEGQIVTISIEPGNYEEMLVVEVDDVVFANASENPSIALKNKGVDIDDNAVRITSYYGHGYAYSSMTSSCKWDARTLMVNKENGYYSFANPGSGTTSGSYWNATVVVTSKNVTFENIILENSFNQYISKKESEDVVTPLEGCSTGNRPTTVGDVTVQNKSFVERAAALAVLGDKIFLDNCRVIGRQDTFYGGTGSRVACNGGALMGGTDFLFGAMILTCYQTDLVMNTSNDKNDVSYLTAAQQSSGRGYLMFECTVKSAEVGTETASTMGSKPGYFGRPWKANTSEVVFAGTTIENSTFTGYEGQPLIVAAGWNNSLSGESSLSVEYGSNVATTGRVAWAPVLTEPITADGTEMKLINWTKGTDDWDPYGSDVSSLLPKDASVATAVAENIDKEIVAIEYYSLSGQKMASPARGVNMVVKVYGDGTKNTEKVVVK